MSAQKIKIAFSKSGDLRFISHLDLVRLFQRAFRRAHLPVTITKGFNPRLKISIIRALKLGLASKAEEAIVCMDEKTAVGELMARVNSKLPEGVRVEMAEELI